MPEQKKSMLKTAVLAAVFLLWVPCAVAALGSKEKSAEINGKVTLEFWTWRAEDVEFYEKIIRAFEKKISCNYGETNSN